MSKRKPNSHRKPAPADDHLLRALRQVADDALEETVPDRLLQVIRAARGREGEREPSAAEPTPPDEPA
jgi:hypothetical protein